MRFLLLNIVLPIVATGVVLVVYRLRRRWQRHASQGWPMVQGKVERRYLDPEGDSEGAAVAYSYSVNGEYYTGYRTLPLPVRETVCRLIDSHTGDAKVLIRYHPGQPWRSVLLEEDQLGER